MPLRHSLYDAGWLQSSLGVISSQSILGRLKSPSTQIVELDCLTKAKDLLNSSKLLWLIVNQEPAGIQFGIGTQT